MKLLLTNPACKYPINNRYEKYFIRSGSRWPHSRIKRIGEIPSYLPFPFFLAYSASLLLQDKHDVYVLDAVALDYDDARLIKEAENIRPDIILFETTTPTITHDLHIARRLKEATGAKIILAGPHAAVYADSLMKTNLFIDYILKGEYELNCAKLIKRLSNNDSASVVGGVVYRDTGSVIAGSDEPAGQDESLDILPMPARNLFPSNKINDIGRYWDGFCQFRPAIQMQATRGCPYQCYFCLWNEVMYKHKKYRKFSPYRVVEEISYVMKEYGAREVYFDDDDFTIDKAYVYEICSLIIKEKLDIRWSCMADAVNLDKETLKLMKQAGCIGVKFGLESLSPKVLAMINKPVSLEKAKQTAKHCAQYKIRSHAAFAAGLLNEDVSSLNETLAGIKTLDVDTIQVSFAVPFPGTSFYDLAKSKGFINGAAWEDYDGSRKQVLRYPLLDEKMFKQYKSKLYRYWLISRLLQPAWVLRQIFYLKRYIKGQGIKRIMEQVLNIIYAKG